MRLKPRIGRISLTVLLSTAIGMLILLSVGTVLAITATANFKNTFELLVNTGEMTMDSFETYVRGYVDPAEDLADHMVHLVRDGELDVSNSTQVKDTLLGALGPSPQIGGIVVWDADGHPVVVLEEEDGAVQVFDPPVSDDEAPTEETVPPVPTWSAPVTFSQTTFINLRTALHHDDQYVGAFATGINTASLSAKVREIGGNLGMTAFVLYGENLVLAHPALESAPGNSIPVSSGGSLDLMSLSEFGDPILAAFPRRETDLPIKSPSFETSVLELDDEGYLFLTKEIHGYGPRPWTIGVYASAEDFGDQFRRLLGSTAIAFLILIVAIVLGILLARYLARPIIQLSKAEAMVGNLELDNIKVPGSSFIREINDQITAFHRMIDGLRTFETYVPKALVQKIISQGDSGEITSTESELTLMFTDIISFTKLSENLPPAEVARLLNEHFTIINECIEAEGGTVDKFIGDAVMAFWGAPDAQEDQAARACRAALAIRQRMEQADRTKPEDPRYRLKISIHSGPLIVGNIGAPGRINYTVVGDTVNTCSRILDLCVKADDGIAAATILVSDQITREAGDGLCFEPAGSFEVRGKTQAVEVFRLIGDAARTGVSAAENPAGKETAGSV